MSPRVSLIVCAYNAAWCVERALESALGQRRLPDEILVADDGSNDGTAELVEAGYGDRVRLLRLAHRGITATRIVALAESRGDWFAILDADDTWMPDKLERQLAFLERHPEVRWISTDGSYVSAEGVIRASWLSDYFDPVRSLAGDMLPTLVERCFPLASSVMVQTEAYHQVGGFDPAYLYSQDYDLWLRLSARYPGGLLAEPLVTYYSSPGQLSRRYEERYRDDLRLMQRIARGELGRRPGVQRHAAERAAALEFDIALVCLRSGRLREGRQRLWQAAAAGPFSRRLVAACGALLPHRALPRLVRSAWLKESVQRTRRQGRRMRLDDPAGGAA